MAKCLADELNMPFYIVRPMVDELLNIIVEKTRLGHTVSIKNFANFSTSMKSARPARNPRNGEPHEVKPRLRLNASFSANQFK